MTEDGDEASTAFVRQRRDLFVASAGLWLVQAAGIRAEKLALLGMEFEIGNGGILVKALWALWAYWFVRYYQAFRTLPARPIRDAYGSFFYRALLRVVEPRCDQEARAMIKSNYRGAVVGERTHYGWNIADGEAVFNWAPRLMVEGKAVDLPARELRLSKCTVNRCRIKAVLDITFNSTCFTDYIFPFFFGMLPALFWVMA